MGFLQGSTKVSFRDVYDHIIQIGDTVETLREMVSSMMEVYLSSVSYRLNGVMKVLTIITTIFMPLSFIASIYGMNFEHMPELEIALGLSSGVSVMAVTGLAMLYFFKQKVALTRRSIEDLNAIHEVGRFSETGGGDIAKLLVVDDDPLAHLSVELLATFSSHTVKIESTGQRRPARLSWPARLPASYKPSLFGTASAGTRRDRRRSSSN